MNNYIDEIIGGLALYFFLVATLTYFAKEKKIGSFKIFVISLLLTPIVGVLVYFFSEPIIQYKTTFQCPVCHFEFDQQGTFCTMCEHKGRQVKLIPMQRIDHP